MIGKGENMELKGVSINPTPAAVRDAGKLFECCQKWNLAKSLQFDTNSATAITNKVMKEQMFNRAKTGE